MCVLLKTIRRSGCFDEVTFWTTLHDLAALDRKERATLTQGHRSVAHSARTLRVAMTLHVAHAFTHAAAVDGSKIGVNTDVDTAEEDEEHNAEDRLAPSIWCMGGIQPVWKARWATRE